MKRVLTSLILAFALSGMMALQATDFSSNDSLAALGYVMLNPLDTSSLPVIPIKDCGGKMVRSALNSDATWHGSLKQLQRHHFSDESVYKLMLKMYRFTHKHYVTFPVAYWSTDPQGD